MISFASDLQIFWPKAKCISALSLETQRASVSAGSVRTFIAGMLGCHCGFGLIHQESFHIFDSEPVVRFYWITPFLRTERVLFSSQRLKVCILDCLHFSAICVPSVWYWKICQCNKGKGATWMPTLSFFTEVWVFYVLAVWCISSS